MRSVKGKWCLPLCLLVLAVLMPCGCGTGGDGWDYTVRVGETVIGSETVTVRKKSGGFAYRETARRPYLAQSTVTDRQLDVSKDRRLQGYFCEVRKPGAPFRTYLDRVNGKDVHLKDDLQIFEYYPPFESPPGLLPLEPDSVCLAQALLDKFIAYGGRSASTNVVVPSRGGVIRAGALKRIGPDRASFDFGGLMRIDVRFEKGSGRIVEMVSSGVGVPAGMKILKGSARVGSSKPFVPEREGYSVDEVRIQTMDGRELGGSMYIPDGKPPYRAVVLIGDVGPLDRTGSGVLSGVADGLARNGMAVLTCDKRGVPGSGGRYGTYTLDSAADDLNAQIQYLVTRGDVDIDGVGVAGWGEGGVVASKAAAGNPYIGCCVLMATPAVKMFPDLAVIQAQEAGERGLADDSEVKAVVDMVGNISRAVGGTGRNTVDIGQEKLFLGWMRSHMRYDPGGTLKALTVPVLVVQGEEDSVVPPEQARELMALLGARRQGEQSLLMFKGVGHGFGEYTGEGRARPYRSHYRVEPRVLGGVCRWLKEKLGVR